MKLAGRNEKESADIFPKALMSNSALAESALRLSEHEVLH